jgi:hypothetical protein
MDCQKLIVYGILVLVGIYVLRDVCGIKLPMIEGFENFNAGTNQNSELLGNASPGNATAFNQPVAPVNNQAVPNANNGLPNGQGAPSQVQPGTLSAAEAGSNEFNLPIQGIQTAPANCYPQNTLAPQDLLPDGEAAQIEQFNEGMPEVGEGILRGVNFLDAGFHVGVNTIGQSLRNANLNLRAEPPNPRTQVSPWMMSTIDIDLARRPLADGDCNLLPGQATQ